MTSHVNSACNSVVILALLLLLGGGGGSLELVASSAETSGPYDPNAAIEIYYETNRREQSAQAGSGQGATIKPELYQQQRRKSDFQDNNLKRYLFKEVDGDGYAVNSPAERRHYINLRELLDTIDASPIYRSGRTGPGDVKSPTSNARTLFGLSWEPVRAGPSSSYALSSSAPKNNHPRHVSLGAEQLSYGGPSNSITDYEWKRVENTRWNNLRGMWGKRSLDGNGNKWANALYDGGRQQQQQPQQEVANMAAEVGAPHSEPGKQADVGSVEGAGQQKNNV